MAYKYSKDKAQKQKQTRIQNMTIPQEHNGGICNTKPRH